MRCKIVLAYDLGGTKVAAGIVTHKGVVLEEIREPVAISHGKRALLRQLSDMGQALLIRHPGVRSCGVASAGPLNPATGELLDPTNFSTDRKGWGVFPLARLLSKSLKLPVTVDNDAAAAINAEHWVGAAREVENCLILTLGTGLGTGVICNGQLVRAGRGLHTEGGHLILNSRDKSAPCGCGNFGCAEAYLSGSGFTRRFNQGKNHAIEAPEIAEKARAGDARAKRAFAEYSEHLAVALHNFAVIYAPELVLLAGSFAATADLFLPATLRHLKPLLARRRQQIDFMPKIRVSKLNNNAGLIGAAHIALQ